MPTIADDTLSGFAGTRARHVALAAIEGVAVRKTNTLAMIGVGMLVVGGILAMAVTDQCFTVCGVGPIFR